MSIATQSQPLILTLKLDDDTFRFLDGLRLKHFPAERNFLRAHVTLFHKLRGEREIEIRGFLQTFCARSASLHLSLPRLRFLGKGVAAEIECPELHALRKRLAEHFNQWLTPQDRQGFRPHVTIQNKVAPDEARLLYEELANTWQPLAARGEALQLWRYLGAPWELLEEFKFEDIAAELDSKKINS